MKCYWQTTRNKLLCHKNQLFLKPCFYNKPLLLTLQCNYSTPNIFPPRFKISKSETELYWKNGYVILKNVFPEKEMTLLRETIENDKQIHDKNMEIKDNDGRLSKITLWNDLGDDLYSQFVRCATTNHILETLHGTEMYHIHSKVSFKEPKVGGKWEFHQDFGYWYEQV